MRRRGEDVVEEAISVGWQGWDGVVRREEAVRNVEVVFLPTHLYSDEKLARENDGLCTS